MNTKLLVERFIEAMEAIADDPCGFMDALDGWAENLGVNEAKEAIEMLRRARHVEEWLVDRELARLDTELMMVENHLREASARLSPSARADAADASLRSPWRGDIGSGKVPPWK